MRFDELLAVVGDEPVFDTGLLLAGQDSPAYVRRQLSGWVHDGKLWQLRRGLYALPPPYQKVKAHPFVVANRLVSGSYVSLQAALAFYGLIPEYVPVVTSVTAGRPAEWRTPLGQYTARRIHTTLFGGYQRLEVSPRQHAFVATPAKALLDLVYLETGGDSELYLAGLRLQNLERLDMDALQHMAQQSGKPKLLRAAATIMKLALAERGGDLL